MGKIKKYVSVVIPAKDRLKFLREALESVFKQDHELFNLDVIVVDDGSKKSLKSILQKKFPNVRFIRNNSFKHGPAIARNLGLKYVKGNYVCFLDSDDKWKPDFLSKSVQLLDDRNIVATVCLSDPYYYGKFPLFRKIKLIILNFVRTITLLLAVKFKNSILPTNAFYLCQLSHMVFKKNKIGRLKFDENSVAAEDWNFNFDSSRYGFIEIVPYKLVDFRYVLKSNTFESKVKKSKRLDYERLLSKIAKQTKKDLFYYLFKIYTYFFLVK